MGEILIPKLKEFSRQELLTGLSPLRILVGPANSIEDLVKDRHLQERETFHHYNEGTHLIFPSNPIKMSKTPPKFERSAPSIEACNLADFLKFKDSESQVIIGIDHSLYNHMTKISKDTKNSLIKDFI